MVQELNVAQENGSVADPEGQDLTATPAGKPIAHGPGKDSIIDFNPDGIPAELKELPQWVCWRLEEQDGKKPKKVPLNPQTGRKAKTNNPRTWGTFDQAMEYSQSHMTDGCCGVGFVFSKDDPYAGIDLDKCRDAVTG